MKKFNWFILLIIFIFPLCTAAQEQPEVEKAPAPINLGKVKSRIIYPDSAKANDIEGRVVVMVLIGEDGIVIDINDEKMEGPTILYEAAKTASWNLLFEPARDSEGNPIKCWVSVPYSFQLSKKYKEQKEKPPPDNANPEKSKPDNSGDNKNNNSEVKDS